MRATTWTSLLWRAYLTAAFCTNRQNSSLSSRDVSVVDKDCDHVAPKVFIITMFPPEAQVWYDNSTKAESFGDLFAKNITVAGFSPLFPDAHCTANGEVCLMTTGEAEINAAASVSALMLTPLFNLTSTYFLIAGIAGVNPNHGTLADVTFSKYAVQVALQYEFDAREIPANWRTGYVPQGSDTPNSYPEAMYGTEIFEVNESLRDIAVEIATNASLTDSADSAAYRKNYNVATSVKAFSKFAMAVQKPGILSCDVVTSDTYFSGTILGEAFENTAKIFTNGSAVYCMTAQEDNATLGAMLRGALANAIDFRRIIIMRSASDFDRPYPGITSLENLFNTTQGAFFPAIFNLFIAGNPVVMGILHGWDTRFAKGIEPKNYVGDLFNSLDYGIPDFGPPDMDLSDNPMQKRDLYIEGLWGRDVEVKNVVGNPIGKGKYEAMVARMVQSGAS